MGKKFPKKGSIFNLKKLTFLFARPPAVPRSTPKEPETFYVIFKHCDEVVIFEPASNASLEIAFFVSHPEGDCAW